jgi:hypothetical protein
MCWSNNTHATSCVHVNSEGCVAKADVERGTVLLMVALEDRFIGGMPVDADLLRHAMAADDLAQEPLGGILIVLFCSRKSMV